MLEHKYDWREAQEFPVPLGNMQKGGEFRSEIQSKSGMVEVHVDGKVASLIRPLCEKDETKRPSYLRND